MSISGSEVTKVAEPFIDGLRFGEGPRWHEGRLWYSDFYEGAVFSVSEDGERRQEITIPDDQPSGLGWMPDGTMLVVLMHQLALARVESPGSLARYATLGPWATSLANDMVVSADGRAYVGNFGFDLDGWIRSGATAPFSTTSLVRVDPDGSSHEAAGDMAFPNGSVIFPDGRTLVVAETLGGKLTAFDITGDGSLANRRVWAQLQECAPDGICLDAQGCIWVANALGHECIRVAEGGKIVDRVQTPQFCYACMLGGADGRTLFCVTAPSSVADEVRDRTEGRIVRARVDVPGDGLP